MQAEEVWFGESPVARLARTALLPASGLYGTGFAVYRMLYDLGIKRAYRSSIPVLCVGNLAVGGNGKTPTVLHLIDVLRALGREPVVSASGYGSPRAEAATIAPEGPLDPCEWGDEPAMMRWLRPDLRLVVGRRRPLAARLAAEAFPDGILVMDDGFQHLPLAKSLTILLDPSRPVNPFPLPAGPYREFRAARRRAQLVLGDAQDRGFRLVYSASEVQTPEGQPVASRETSLLTAIARPERLIEGMHALGYRPSRILTLPDHDPLDAPDLLREFDPARTILTTPKDWVKLSLRPDRDRFTWGIVHRSARIEGQDATGAPFAQWLDRRLGIRVGEDEGEVR